MKTVWWMFVVLVSLIILRRPDMITNPQPWAEDATMFLNQAITDGVLSVFNIYAGNLHVVPRIITLVSLYFSELLGRGISLVPLFMNTLAILVSGLCVFFLCTPYFDWLASIRKRILTSMLVVCIPGVAEVFGNVTNLQWWLGIFQFLFVLYVFKHNKIPSKIIAGLFVITGLTGPIILISLCFLLFVVARELLLKKVINKNIRWLIISTSIVSLIQFITAFKMRVNQSELQPSVESFFVYFPKVVLVSFDRIIFSELTKSVNYFQFTTAALIGLLVIWAVYKFVARDNFLFSMAYILMVYLFTFMGSPGYFLVFADHSQEEGGRYMFIPIAILIILIFTSVNFKENGLKKILSSILSAAYVWVVLMNYSQASFVDMKWKEQVKKYDRIGTNICTVQLNPNNWLMNIPCK